MKIATTSQNTSVSGKETDRESERPNIIMNDEHLAIILKGIQARLEIALRQASESLPEEERVIHAIHIAEACEPYLLHLPCDDDAHWVERLAFYPIALNPVAHLIDELSHEISRLTNVPKKPAARLTPPAKTKAAKKRAAAKTRGR
ncbi:MAG: hypothetical protein HYR56_25905 [Acidobacteria bacterium]|nr:hypothetical protein [Acidobacteriota bacterium]MBI3425085.1 hypothetical protein [Acidobacteriota bacterium]